MVRSLWKGFVLDGLAPCGNSSRPRRQRKLGVGCEALDTRQLLSAVVPAGAAFSTPAAGVAAKAASILERDAPTAFAQFQTALARAEQQSHVNPTDVTALAQDESVVDQDLASANASGLNDVQDWVDNAFTYGSDGIRDVRRNLVPLSEASRRLDAIVGGAPALFNGSPSDGSVSPIDQLADQIAVVAKQAKLTPAVQSALNRGYTALNKALGPHPYVSLGPGASNVRDPLVVYYDAQVDNFVK
jgi:hypothetical protein